jgi:hypothetical protein
MDKQKNVLRGQKKKKDKKKKGGRNKGNSFAKN